MRILITGATGFVGQALGKELNKRGHEVLAIVRDKERAKSEFSFPTTLFHWNEGEHVHNVHAVIHLAGESIAAKRWSREQKEKILFSRTNTAKQLKEFVEKTKGERPKLWISASAVGFYGNRGEEELVETSIPGSGFLSEVCVAWEKAAWNWEAPRTVIFRIGMVIGKGGGALSKILPLFRMRLGGNLGSGQQWMSWIHLEDLVRMFLFAIETEHFAGTWNAVSPEPVRNETFTKCLAKSLGVWAPFPAPAMILRLTLGEMSTLFLDSQRVKSCWKQVGFSYQYPDLASAFTSILEEEKQTPRQRTVGK